MEGSLTPEGVTNLPRDSVFLLDTLCERSNVVSLTKVL